MRWLVVVLVLVAGCFEPQIPPGLACSEELTCPVGQLCIGGACIIPQACDPVLQDCPPRGGGPQNCYVGELGDGVCAPPGPNSSVGSPCMEQILNICVGGAGCVDGVCRAFCDFTRFPDQPGTCGFGQTCKLVSRDVGACR
jgi:hypothetical protein